MFWNTGKPSHKRFIGSPGVPYPSSANLLHYTGLLSCPNDLTLADLRCSSLKSLKTPLCFAPHPHLKGEVRDHLLRLNPEHEGKNACPSNARRTQTTSSDHHPSRRMPTSRDHFTMRALRACVHLRHHPPL